MSPFKSYCSYLIEDLKLKFYCLYLILEKINHDLIMINNARKRENYTKIT